MDVLVGCFGDHFRVGDVGKDTDTAAGDGGWAGEGDDGNAHPEGVAGGGAADIGEGVEGDVDFVVLVHVFWQGEFLNEGHAVGGDSGIDEHLSDAIAVAASAGVEDEMGVGDGGEDIRPGVQCCWRQFAEIVEAAEGDEVFGGGGKWGLIQIFNGGLIAPIAVGEID